MKHILLIVLSALLLSSCKKGLLDPNPTDRVSEKLIWESAELMEAFVNQNYNDISEGFYSWKGHGDDNQMLAAVSDETVSDYEGYEGRNVLVDGTLNPDNVERHRMLRLSWSNIYFYINSANIFLKNAPAANAVSDDVKKRLIAEMKVLRAFRYFTILRRFGGGPLIAEPFALGADYNGIRRGTLAETVSFIKADLDAAIPDLSATSATGRITKGVAQALNSRLLLYAASPLYSSSNDLAKWQAAADAAKVVIDGASYQLEPTLEGLRTIFYNGSSSSKEIIFRQQTHVNTGPGGIYAVVEYNFVRAGGTVGAGAYSYYTPTQQMVDAYEMANGKLITDATSGYNDQTPYSNRDPRFYKFIYHHGAPFKSRMLDYSSTGRDRPATTEYRNPTGYNMRKFANEDYFNASGTSTIAFANQPDRIPWIHIRYAEILLNYAEAINEAQGPALAYAAINQIRQRAGMPNLPIGLSQDQMRDRIRNERRVELAFEEHRYYDVRRWKIAPVTENINVKAVYINKVAGVDVYTYGNANGVDMNPVRKFLPQHYFWPLTRGELRASPGLVQNPGYQ